MTAKEIAKDLIEQIPESKIQYVIAFLQGAAIPDTPLNAATMEAIEELEAGGGEVHSGSTEDFFAAMMEEK